jgi:molybdenum cofactor cytidylyltransferase
MSQASSLCAIILAAGESSRMGSDKALLSWPPAAASPAAPNQTFLSAAIESLNPFSEMVIVVVGANEQAVAPVIYASGASLVRNPDPARGQFSSLRVGLQEVLNHGRDAAIVTLVDRPPANSATLQSLASAFIARTENIWAIVPEHNGKHGHPYWIAREMIEAFLRAPATATARDVEHQNQPHIEYVAVNDPFVTLNVNTQQDYLALPQVVR